MLKLFKQFSMTNFAVGRTPSASDRFKIIVVHRHPQRLPELPIEIIIEIFEIAVYLSNESAATISLVSSWARKIAVPHLFSTIVSHAAPLTPEEVANASKSSQAPTSRTKLSPYLGGFVQHLWTERTGISNIANEVDLFRACPNVEHLALSSPSLQSLSMACRMHRKTSIVPAFPSSLRSITMITPTYRYEWHILVGVRVPNGGLLLHNITHLRLLEMGAAAYAPHAHLPNLTPSRAPSRRSNSRSRSRPPP
ncbi:hypothetical protein SCP_0211430 [Sparassis crispa]|uniref:Uncharacterized protein n=1 Tax=Sparassis crispa TaxID=139825 RepID=A0A401GCS7_9APHY|nr:hypothetical protein SCP_0211430 [Sparassis crispa]GBE79941.1 hypothetical protein SCP_0211430 [Sparassis crispa]